MQNYTVVQSCYRKKAQPSCVGGAAELNGGKFLVTQQEKRLLEVHEKAIEQVHRHHSPHSFPPGECGQPARIPMSARSHRRSEPAPAPDTRHIHVRCGPASAILLLMIRAGSKTCKIHNRTGRATSPLSACRRRDYHIHTADEDVGFSPCH